MVRIAFHHSVIKRGKIGQSPRGQNVWEKLGSQLLEFGNLTKKVRFPNFTLGSLFFIQEKLGSQVKIFKTLSFSQHICFSMWIQQCPSHFCSLNVRPTPAKIICFSTIFLNFSCTLFWCSACQSKLKQAHFEMYDRLLCFSFVSKVYIHFLWPSRDNDSA